MGPLLSAEELQAMAPEERHITLDGLRVELYALSAIIAEDTLRRSLEAREQYPPLGLVRSLFTDFGVISSSPSPLAEGSIDDFRSLGKALIDTTVYHLDGLLKEVRKSERGWLVDRLAKLLVLFRLGADRQAQARMRDSFSFIYGGLQFGTSTCVQLAEVMARLLGSDPEVNPARKLEMMRRSIRPAYDLAALGIDDVSAAYAKLQPAAAGPDAGKPGNPAGWMDPARFSRRQSDDEASRIVLNIDLDDELAGLREKREPSATYSTRGCPARVSPAGTRSTIGELWAWTVDLTAHARLLERPGG